MRVHINITATEWIVLDNVYMERVEGGMVEFTDASTDEWVANLSDDRPMFISVTP